MSIETVRRIYDAFARGDLDAVMDECAADVVVAQDPALPWGGRYVGREGIAEFASKLVGTIDSAVDTEQLFQAGDHVVQQGRTKLRAPCATTVPHSTPPSVTCGPCATMSS